MIESFAACFLIISRVVASSTMLPGAAASSSSNIYPASLTTRLQKLFIVCIYETDILSICSLIYALSAPSSYIALRRLSSIFSRICEAASFVKVTTRSSSIPNSFFIIFAVILAASTVVLPEPAAADTRIFDLPASIIACCSSENFTILLPLLP